MIALLGDSSPYRGNILFQVQGALEETAHQRGFEESRVVALMVLRCMTCIRILEF